MNKNIKNTNQLLIAIIIGIICGVLLGGIWPAWGKAIYFLGELFIKSLLMLVVPLIMASMVVGISGLGDIRKLGGLGRNTIVYYILTTAISARNGNPEIVKLLIDSGVNADMTALNIALLRDHTEIVNLLEKAGAKE